MMSNLTTANAGTYHAIQAIAGKYSKPPRPNPMLPILLAAAILLGLLWPLTSKAESTDKVAHLGVSYAMTTGFYGLYKAMGTRDCRIDRRSTDFACPLKPSERLTVAIFAAVTSSMVGLVKEMGDSQPDGGDLVANSVGNLIGIGSICLFEF